MKKLLLQAILCFLIVAPAKAQYDYYQYFDGADTSILNSVFIDIDPDTNNVWQIGPPQKTFFNAASTVPNVMVTDTINPIPVNNTSRFSFTLDNGNFAPGILAIQWKQKLDMDPGLEGGIIEYSLDNGQTWFNVFNNPFVYNFYGFNQINADTIDATSEFAFSGRDTLWQDIWLCFLNNVQMQQDTITLRFTLKTDSINDVREGWMIDNLSAHITIIHTAKGGQQVDAINAFPNATTGIVNIETTQLASTQVIEEVYLFSTNGQLIKTYSVNAANTTLNLSDQARGTYYLKVKSNLMTETFVIFLED
ncbi:MAG: T9SS type A sorting domain-containing protein [Bacteroidia bacterium]